MAAEAPDGLRIAATNQGPPIGTKKTVTVHLDNIRESQTCGRNPRHACDPFAIQLEPWPIVPSYCISNPYRFTLFLGAPVAVVLGAMPFPDQPQLDYAIVELWRGKIRAARLEYETATANFQVVASDSASILPPDGSLNLLRALRKERTAREEYMRVLKVYTDYLLSGKIPEEL